MTHHKCTAALLRAKCLPQPFGSCPVPAGLLCKTCVQLHTCGAAKLHILTVLRQGCFAKQHWPIRSAFCPQLCCCALPVQVQTGPKGQLMLLQNQGHKALCVNICAIRSVGKLMLGSLVWDKLHGLRFRAALPDWIHAFNLMRGCFPCGGGTLVLCSLA